MDPMVEPQRQPDDGPSAGPGRRLAVLGAMALALAAIFVLGRFAAPTTTTAPEAVATIPPTPTTTSTTLFPEEGRFRWGLAVRLDHMPTAVHALQGNLLVYGHGPEGRGLELWMTSPWFGSNPDGRLVIDIEHQVDTIAEQGEGLLALGHEVASGRPVAWTSPDGIAWEKTMLPDEGLEGLRPWFYGALSVGDLTIARAEVGDPIDMTEVWERAETALRARFGELMRSFYISGVETDITFTVLGPLDLNLGSVSARELGLDPEDFVPSSKSGQAAAWVSRDGETWELLTGNLPGAWGEMFEGPDGRIWSDDPASQPGGLIATSDGVSWRRLPSTSWVSNIRIWGGRLVALDQGGVALVTSSDGANWTRIQDPEGVLAMPWRSGWVGLMDAGASGLAVILSQPGDSDSRGSQPSDVIVKREGEFELWATWDGHLILRRLGVVVTHIQRWDPRPDQIGFDLDSGTVTIRIPATGEAAITVTGEELRKAEGTRQATPWDPGDVRRGIVFTDGDIWTIEGLGQFDRGQIYRLKLFDDRLVLVVHDQYGHSVYTTSLP